MASSWRLEDGDSSIQIPWGGGGNLSGICKAKTLIILTCQARVCRLQPSSHRAVRFQSKVLQAVAGELQQVNSSLLSLWADPPFGVIVFSIPAVKRPMSWPSAISFSIQMPESLINI